MATGIESLAWRLSEDSRYSVSVFSGGSTPTEKHGHDSDYNDVLARVKYTFAGGHFRSRQFRKELRTELAETEPHIVVGWVRTVVALPVRHLGTRYMRRRYPFTFPIVIVNEGEDRRWQSLSRRLREKYRTGFRLLLHALGQLSRGEFGPRGEILFAVANSRAVAESLRSIYGIPKNRISVIHRGVDTFLFQPVEAGLTKRRPQSIVTTGNINEEKGYGRVASALQYAKSPIEWTAIGLGDSKYIAKISSDVTQAGHVFRHLGPLPHRDLAPLLRQQSLFVLLSSSEGFSKSLLEAMASGCIPIVSDIPSLREAVTHGVTGFVAPKSLAEVGALIDWLSGNPNELDRLRVFARNAVVDCFSATEEVQRWKRLIDAVAREHFFNHGTAP